MADVTLFDLIAWEPRLTIASVVLPGEAKEPDAVWQEWLEREISWVVTIRPTAPLLPLLRGGEVVMLPDRLVEESGLPLNSLLRELAATPEIAGVILGTRPDTAPPTLPVLLVNDLQPEFETELNRLLTQHRGDLYRRGTDLGRLLARLATAGGSLDQIVVAAARALEIGIAVCDTDGNPLEMTGADALPPPGDHRHHLAMPLASGETVWFGPVPATERALVRLAAERIVVALESTLVRSAQYRPHGAERVAALNRLLTSRGTETQRIASHAGLALNASYRVVLVSSDLAAGGVSRLLAAIGIQHEAGQLDDALAALVETRYDHPPVFSSALLRQSFGAAYAADRSETGWIAMSAVAHGVPQVPERVREARFCAALLHRQLIRRPIVRFDLLDDLGVYRLLYQLWGTAELQQFSQDALGDLINHDRRGLLRETLLAFLDSGGSHVETAHLLGIHRNTLSYRLKQIADQTGRDPADPSARLTLHLGLLGALLPPPPASK